MADASEKGSRFVKVLVLGATGGTGRLIVEAARERGWQVRALVRSGPTARARLPGAELIKGDALDASSLRRAVAGCDAVVSALGPSRISLFRKVTMLSEHTRVLLPSMRDAGVARLVCITGIGAGDSRGHAGLLSDWIALPIFLREIYKDKTRQEELIRASDRDWVIVRPTALKDRPGNGRIRVLDDLAGFHGGDISRADVAAFALDQVKDDGWVRRPVVITQATGR